MSHHPVHYELFSRRTPQSSWVLEMASEARDQVIQTADDMLKSGRAAVRVTKEMLDPESGEYSSVTVLEKGISAPAKKPKLAPATDTVCTSPQDLYSALAREKISRLLEDWLKLQSVTAFELLHRPDLAERLEASGSELLHVVQKLAVPESHESGQDLHDLMRRWSGLFDKACTRLIQDGRKSLFPELTPENGLDASLRRENLREPRERFGPLLNRALAIDAGSAVVQFALAMWSDRSNAERDAAFRRGMALDPSNGRGLTAYAEFLRNTGHAADAGKIVAQALRIDPVSPRAHFAAAMFSLDVYGAAELEARMLHVLELDPTFVPALQRYSKYRWEHHGELAAAVRLLEQALAADPGNPWLRHTAVAVYLDLDDVAAARDIAAGTPQSAASTELLLALHDGDWKRAGLAAFAPAGWSYNNMENWEAGEALRDFALRSGALARSAEFITLKFNLGPEPTKEISLQNFRQAAYLSQLFAAQGRNEEAQHLREAVAAWNDANQPKYGAVFARRTRAMLWLLEGRKDDALAELAGSFQSLDYMHWWYTLRRDPLWMPLHKDPRFEAIVAEVRRHVAAQRELLEQYRREGSVPRRPATPLRP